MIYPRSILNIVVQFGNLYRKRLEFVFFIKYCLITIVLCTIHSSLFSTTSYQEVVRILSHLRRINSLLHSQKKKIVTNHQHFIQMNSSHKVKMCFSIRSIEIVYTLIYIFFILLHTQYEKRYFQVDYAVFNLFTTHIHVIESLFDI
jgi:hypothetical protein